MNTSAKKRNGAIDFWKFVFSIMVIHFHSFNLTKLETKPFVGITVAVEFFFLVSGFLMAASIFKYKEEDIVVGRDSRKFLLHKIRGLCPEIFIAWGIGFVVQHIAVEGLSVKMLAEDLISGVWELFFLRMSGLAGFRANAATWYISAMLLAMMLLVPLFLKNRDTFLNVWAPILSIFVLAYLYKNVGDLRDPTDWLGFCYKGLLRAVGELSLGCICWGICQKIKDISYTKLARVLLTVFELICYLAVFVWGYSHKGSKMDFVMLLFLAVGVTLTFSNQSLLSSYFNNSFVQFLGKISLSLYLAHDYWSHVLGKIFPQDTYPQLYLKYVIVTAVTAFVIYFTAKGIRKIAPAFLAQCQRLFIEADK